MSAFQPNAFQPNAFQIGQASGAADTNQPRDAVYVAGNKPRQLGFTEFGTNLLLTTLAVVAIPFSQDDWQNPQVRKPVQQVEQAQNNLALNPSKGVTFGRQLWENPQFKRFQQPDVGQNLLGLTATPAAKPFLQSDWPLVTPSKWFRQQEPVGHRDATETPSPFSPVIWANPTGKKWTQVEQAQSRLALTTIIVAGDPFRQLDWQNPTVRKWQQNAGFESNPQTYWYTDYYYPSDNQWPNPQRGKPPQQPEQVGNRLALTTVVVAGDPFRQSDWQNPQQVKINRQDVVFNKLPLFYTVIGDPFRQTSWPNPLIAKGGEGFIPESLFGTILAPTVDTTTQQRQGVYTQRFVVQQPDQNQYVNTTILLPDTPVPPVTAWPMGGSGWPVDWQGKRKKAGWDDRPNAHLKHILDKVVSEVYGDVVEEAPTAVKAEAKSIVKPFVITKTKGVPSVSNVDWDLLEQDVKAVRAIYELYIAYLNDIEDDDEVWLLLN